MPMPDTAEAATTIIAKKRTKESDSQQREQLRAWFETVKAIQNPVLAAYLLDRLSRLNESDWDSLKAALNAKQIKVVAVDLPTSWIMAAPADDFTARMFTAINGMMLDMLAAISRKDYTARRERAAQGVQKAKAAGKYQGRVEDTERNLLIQKHLTAGLSSWNEIMALVGCNRGTVAKQAAILKAATAA